MKSITFSILTNQGREVEHGHYLFVYLSQASIKLYTHIHKLLDILLQAIFSKNEKKKSRKAT